MKETSRISLRISSETQIRLDRHIRNFGVTRDHLIEQALEHYLQALEKIPNEFITPKRIVLSRESAAEVQGMTERPPKPTEPLKKALR